VLIYSLSLAKTEKSTYIIVFSVLFMISDQMPEKEIAVLYLNSALTASFCPHHSRKWNS